MKKFASVLFSIVLGVSMILALSGCGEKYFNDNLPSKSALVSVDYGDTTQKKARLQIKNDNESFDISGFALYGKTNKKKIKNLCGGDRLEIYYSDDSYEKIDHIFVEKAEYLVLELSSILMPGGFGERGLYSENKKITVNTVKYEAKFAIDKEGNYIDVNSIGDGTKLYGTYIEEEISEVDKKSGLKLHYIHALYTYAPC